MKRAQGKGTGGRMIRCVLSALKAKGTRFVDVGVLLQIVF